MGGFPKDISLYQSTNDYAPSPSVLVFPRILQVSPKDQP